MSQSVDDLPSPDDWKDSPWKEDVVKQLITVFKDEEVEGLLRVLFYLDLEDKEAQGIKDVNDEGNCRISPEWITLKSAMDAGPENLSLFTQYAECLEEDTRTLIKNQKFKDRITVVYYELRDDSADPSPEEFSEGFDIVNLDDFNCSWVLNFPCLANAWNLFPNSLKNEVLYKILEIAGNKGSELVKPPADFPLPLASILLPGPVQDSLNRWWNGDIAGRRCAMNIVNFSFTLGAQIGGHAQGAAIGYAAGGTFGAIAGGFCLGIISAVVMNKIIETLMERLLGVPAKEALENSYDFLGVDMSATNQEINSVYRRLCLKHHPDKGGDQEYFVLLQAHMGVIRAARGNL